MTIIIQSHKNQTPPTITSTANAAWRFAPADLRLEMGEAHIWLVSLDEENAGFERLLSDDELIRAERFRFAPDRKRFVAARAFLRIILGKYLKTNPRLIRFEYNEYGKPFLNREMRSSIKFNLSHSDNLAVYAFMDGSEIGVDIERIKPSLVDDQMLAHSLTAREIVRFRTLPKDERELFFFDCWTRKEAYLKMCGSGFSLPANEIETLMLPETSTDFFDDDEVRKRRLSFQNLPFIAGCAAALAIEASNPQMKFLLHSNAASEKYS